MGFSIIIEGFMMGVGRTKVPFAYNIIGMWLVRIGGTFVCTQLLHMGLVAAWACMIAHNLLLFVLFLICYIKRRMESASDTSEKAAAGINVIACSSNRLEKQDLIETHALPRLSYAVRRSFARAAYCYAELICITYRLK